MSEMRERPRPATFQEHITENDLKEALMGTNGNPTYQEQYGVTVTPTGESPFGPQPSIAELELAAEQAKTRALNPMAFAEAQMQPDFGQSAANLEALQRELDTYKQKYGQSENEKGEIRRRQTELEEAFQGLMAQYQALQTAPQAQSWNSPSPAQYQPPRYEVPQGDPFATLADDDVVQGKSVKQLGAIFANAFMGLQQQTDQRQQALERQLAAQAKVASGITPMEEWRLVAKNPWLANLPEANKIAALQSLKKAEQIQAPQQQVQQEVATQAAAAQDRILSKTTYIEGSKPSVPDSTQAALEAGYQRDYARVMSLPIDPEAAGRGEMYRAQGLRWLAQKYNMPYAKAPSDLAR